MLLPFTYARGIGGSEAPTDRIAVRRSPVFLYFDTQGLRPGATIERAVLSLSPHPSWRPHLARVALYAFGVEGAFTASSLGAGLVPDLASSPAGFADLPARARVPVRLEVTSIVRAWQSGLAPRGGLALRSNDDDPVVLQGADAGELASRPRLEVVVR